MRAVTCLLAMAIPAAAGGIEVPQTVECSSELRRAAGVEFDLAPPGKYVDVCREDTELCKALTAGYPPSVTALAYFVRPHEWAELRKTRSGFGEYLIAQLAGSMRPDEFPGFRCTPFRA